MVHAYAVLLRLYPEAFRRRYAAEMSLDFADALDAARAGGWAAVGAFAAARARRSGREPAARVDAHRPAGAHRGDGRRHAAALGRWRCGRGRGGWDIRPGPPPHAPATPVTEVELLVLAVLALLPVVVVILFAGTSLAPHATRTTARTAVAA